MQPMSRSNEDNKDKHTVSNDDANDRHGFASSASSDQYHAASAVDRRGFMSQTKGVRPKGTDNADANEGLLTLDEINMSFAKWSLADNSAWTCGACTYLNDNPRHLTCAACGATRESTGNTSSKNLEGVAGDQEEEEHVDTVDREFYQDDARQQQNYESKIIEERLQEHVAMQQEMLDEIRREREENERKMKDLREYQQRIMDKIKREKAEREEATCPARQDAASAIATASEDGRTEINIHHSSNDKNDEQQVVEDYRRHLMEQKRTLEESSRHLKSMGGLVRMKGSGKKGSLRRGFTDDGLQNKKERSKDEKEAELLGIMKDEWLERERQLRNLRIQMMTQLELEEAKLRNAAA